MLGLLIALIATFSIFPLYFTTVLAPNRRVYFYIYLTVVLLVGGFMGNVFSLTLADGVAVSGGNICYGAFMMTAVMFVWVEKDVFVLRHLVRLVIVVDLFNVVISYLTQTILRTDGVINVHDVPPSLFEISTPLIFLGGVLIVLELVLLSFIFEFAKQLRATLISTAVIYVFSFVLVLVLDGIIFPFIAFGINPEIVAVVFGGLAGKVLLATAFSMPLALFMFWRRGAFVEYLETDTVRWRLLTASSAELIKEMSQKDEDIRRGDIVFRNSAEGLAITDPDGNIVKSNRAFRELLSVHGGDMGSPVNVKDAFSLDGAPLSPPSDLAEGWRREVLFGLGDKRPGVLAITPAGGNAEGDNTFVYSLTDITEQKEAQYKLEYLASHDTLTGLPNRLKLDEKLTARARNPATLIMIDLDHFKEVNDSYGHVAGDRVLQRIADRLEEVRARHLDANGFLCRVAGDEFAIIISSANSDVIDGILQETRTAFEQSIHINDDLEILMTATIGISSQSDSGDHDLLLEADAALHEAKRQRRGSICVYEERLKVESQKRMMIALRLKNAIANNQIDVHYQPQYDAQAHVVVGVEALVRWTDVELGAVPPSDFIPVAESSGLIDLLGEYVLERACRDARCWIEMGYAPVTMSVNISASQLRYGRFISALPEILKKTSFPASRLEIEVTESSYLEREDEVTKSLEELRSKGISIAIDDFGTGYSSLAYLQDMPCDCIKIDRSFVVGIPGNSKMCNLTSAIIKLAKSMSFKVVAEGVETREQLVFLTEQGSDLIQGYYFSPAVEKAELIKILRRA